MVALDQLPLALQIAEGLQFIASKGYVHRKLSCDNIFITHNLECRIGGFSRAQQEVSDGLL